jgi:hypothetical protein
MKRVHPLRDNQATNLGNDCNAAAEAGCADTQEGANERMPIALRRVSFFGELAQDKFAGLLGVLTKASHKKSKGKKQKAKGKRAALYFLLIKRRSHPSFTFAF